MIELLKTFSISQIIIFIVMLALAIRGLVTFIEWARTKIKQRVHNIERPDRIQDRIDQLEINQESLTGSLCKITEKLDMLIDSDKDAIKAYITERHHHYVYKKGCIDDYTMNILEQRYVHYKDEGGNSFIRQLMDELRSLPKQSYNTTIEKTYNK